MQEFLSKNVEFNIKNMIGFLLGFLGIICLVKSFM
jgi:hypothetical protein